MFQSSQPYSFADQLNEWVQQPMFYAAIASLGLHGILFAALPSFAPVIISDDTQQRVPVMELGAEDISRLPGFVDLDTPNVPQTLLPYDPYDLDSSLGNNDDLDSLEQLLDGLETEPSAPSSDDILIPQLTPLPPPVSLPRLPSNPWPFSSLPTPTPRSPIPIPGPTPSPFPNPASPSPRTAPSTNAAPNSSEPDSNPAQSTSDATPDPDDNQAVARPPAPNPPLSPPETTQANLTELLQYSGPTDNAVVENAVKTALENWKDVIAAQPGITATDDSYISITTEFPKFACLLQTDDIKVMIAVFVDTANQVLASPEPIYILRSWRQWFDDQALKLIQDYEFDNQTGTITSYAVTVTFDYEAESCPLEANPAAATPVPPDPIAPNPTPNDSSLVTPLPNIPPPDSADTADGTDTTDEADAGDGAASMDEPDATAGSASSGSEGNESSSANDTQPDG